MKKKTLNGILWTICVTWTGGAVVAAWYLITHDVPLSKWLNYYLYCLTSFSLFNS